ncbi:MAG: hypothetical protein VX719_05770, partial [Pseudomonadota bacterium]|nr:hypothetical protein [Pseudomonadota bacterium]
MIARRTATFLKRRYVISSNGDVVRALSLDSGRGGGFYSNKTEIGAAEAAPGQRRKYELVLF